MEGKDRVAHVGIRRTNSRAFSEEIERKRVVEEPSGRTTTESEVERRHLEEESEETSAFSFRERQLSLERASFPHIAEARDTEKKKICTRQVVANDPAAIRYRFRWIADDILRSKLPLPVRSPHFMKSQKIPFFHGPELVYVPLYMRATSSATAVDLPDLVWIHRFEFGASMPEYPKTVEQLWALCDFKWKDGDDAPYELSGVWMPELLLRSYPPYVPLVDAASHYNIDQVYDEQVHATEKRIMFIQNPGLPCKAPEASSGSSPPLLALHAPPLKDRSGELRAIVDEMYDHPEKFVAEMDHLRKKVRNFEVSAKAREYFGKLSLREQYEVLNDAVAVWRYYIEALGAPPTQPLPTILSATLIGFQDNCPSIRCTFRGLPDGIWIPILLLIHCRNACKCVSCLDCSCPWRAIMPASFTIINWLVNEKQ